MCGPANADVLLESGQPLPDSHLPVAFNAGDDAMSQEKVTPDECGWEGSGRGGWTGGDLSC